MKPDPFNGISPGEVVTGHQGPLVLNRVKPDFDWHEKMRKAIHDRNVEMYSKAKTAHQLARELLAGPDLPVARNIPEKEDPITHIGMDREYNVILI